MTTFNSTLGLDFRIPHNTRPPKKSSKKEAFAPTMVWGFSKAEFICVCMIRSKEYCQGTLKLLWICHICVCMSDFHHRALMMPHGDMDDFKNCALLKDWSFLLSLKYVSCLSLQYCLIESIFVWSNLVQLCHNLISVFLSKVLRVLSLLHLLCPIVI